MNKKKLSLSFTVSLIVWTGVFVLFNLIIALFDLRSILDNWNIIFDFVTANLYWSMPSSSALAVISFIVNYYSISLNKIKQWFDNFFEETKNQNNKLFLVDQRQNNASLSQFKKVIEHNSENGQVQSGKTDFVIDLTSKIIAFFDIHKTIINDSAPNTKLNYNQEEWTW